jgi:hypothetical protein
MEGHMHSAMMFLSLGDKPGEMYQGGKNPIKKLHAKIPDRWGGNPGHHSVQEYAMASVVEIC